MAEQSEPGKNQTDNKQQPQKNPQGFDSPGQHEPEAKPSKHDKAAKTTAQDAQSPSMQEAKVKPTQSIAKNRSANPSNAKGSHGILLWFLGVVNFILIAGIGATGYMGYQHWQQFTESQRLQLEAGQRQQAQEQRTALTGLTTQLSNSEKSLQSRLAQQDQKIAEQTQLFSEFQGRRPGDWVLAEASYLVRLAGRKVFIDQDLNTALALLHEADSHVASLQRPSLLPVRQAIAGDIQLLKSLQAIDETDIALQLAAMVNQSSLVPFASPEVYYQATQKQPTQSIEDAGYNLGIVWDWIKRNIITYERLEQPIKPYIDGRRQLLIRTNFKTQLQIAQLAILRDDLKLFQIALGQAQAELDNFDTQNEAVMALSNGINTLLALPQQSELPATLHSVEALAAAIAQSTLPAKVQATSEDYNG